MADQAQERGLNGNLDAAQRELRGAERYRQYQRRVRRGNARAADGARPQEFDALGFPIPQRNPSFLERVSRLLNPL
jgi:hypothetical protein